MSRSLAKMIVHLRYIANPEEHHKKITFKDEFREICSRLRIEIDQRYVWD